MAASHDSTNKSKLLKILFQINTTEHLENFLIIWIPVKNKNIFLETKKLK